MPAYNMPKKSQQFKSIIFSLVVSESESEPDEAN